MQEQQEKAEKKYHDVIHALESELVDLRQNSIRKEQDFQIVSKTLLRVQNNVAGRYLRCCRLRSTMKWWTSLILEKRRNSMVDRLIISIRRKNVSIIPII